VFWEVPELEDYIQSHGVYIQDLNSERVAVYFRPESPPPSPIITYIQLDNLINNEPEVVTLE
jgi:hypothetical protein